MKIRQKILVILLVGCFLNQSNTYVLKQLVVADSLLQLGNQFEAIEVLKSLSSQMIESDEKD